MCTKTVMICNPVCEYVQFFLQDYKINGFFLSSAHQNVGKKVNQLQICLIFNPCANF